jgi:RNA polymerase sigma factor (sigma-70 family)
VELVLALPPGHVIMGLTLTNLDSLGQGTMAPAATSTDSDTLDRRLAMLMRDAQAGDKRAYATLLNDCEPVIRRSARKVGLTGDRVEDAVQETLLTLHNARQTYDPSRSFTAWLSVIAQRRAIDTLRRTGRSDRREVHAPLVYEHHADPAADSARGWEDTGRAKDLKAAIANLSASQREAVEHLALREQSLAEASVETGKTTGALKVNLHRALKALRGRLSGERDDNV